MKCIHCEAEVERDDNFCWKCGHWTAKGYKFFKNEDNLKIIMNGDAIKQHERYSILISLTGIFFILFTVMMFVRGDDLFKPFAFLKKQCTNYIYGYNASIIKTDNKYNNENINTYEEALEYIKKDFDEQSWLCENDIDISKIEYSLQNDLNIPSVSFCDVSIVEAKKLEKVIKKIYNLFPNINGALTNITVTNDSSASKYVAYFQPLYQFVNINENINLFNKVNKTQILLNSYYFLNKEIIDDPIENTVGQDWYVSDATWESIIAHELGHYISFVILLKNNGLDYVTFETFNNSNQIKQIIDLFNSGDFSKKIVEEALLNFNKQFNTNINIYDFASTISKYAGVKDENGELIADETIAEAIHDYYLHGNTMEASSKEIIEVIKNRLY